MLAHFAFGSAAEAAGLGSLAGSVGPGVLAGFLLRSTGSSCQGNGLVGHAAGTAGYSHDGQALELGTLLIVRQGGQIKGSSNAAIGVGGGCPGGAVCNVDQLNLRIVAGLIRQRIVCQVAALIGEDINTVTADRQLGAVSKGQVSGVFADHDGCITHPNALPGVGVVVLDNAAGFRNGNGAGVCNGLILQTDPLCRIFRIAHVPDNRHAGDRLCCAADRADALNIGVLAHFAFGCTTDRAGLGCGAGGVGPGVAVRLTVVLCGGRLQLNGLVGDRAGDLIGCDSHDGQASELRAISKVCHAGQVEGNGHAAIGIGGLRPGFQTAGSDVGNRNIGIAVRRSVGGQAAAQIGQDMDAVAGNCHIRAVGKGQFAGELADVDGGILQDKALPAIAGAAVHNFQAGFRNGGGKRLVLLLGLIAGPIRRFLFLAHIPAGADGLSLRILVGRLCHFEGICVGIVHGFDGDLPVLAADTIGSVLDAGDVQAGHGLDEHQAGQVSAVILAHVIAVPGQGIAHQGGTGILHRRAVGHDQCKVAVGHDLILHGRNDGIVHGHLVAAIGGECAVGGILLISPGHVPDQLGIGMSLHISDQIGQVFIVGAFHAAVGAGLLEGNIVPAAAFQCRTEGVVFGGRPGSVVAVIVSVVGKIAGCVGIVLIEGAAADVQVAHHDFFNAQRLCDLPGVLHGIRGEAVADGQDLQNAVAVGIPGLHAADRAGAAHKGMCAIAFGSATEAAGLDADILQPGVAACLAVGSAAGGAGLGCGAGGIGPGMTVHITIALFQLNGLVGDRAGGAVGGDRDDGQALQLRTIGKVCHAGQIEGHGHAAVGVGGLRPGRKAAGSNVGNFHIGIAIRRSVGCQIAAQVGQDMDTVAGDGNIRAVGKGQLTAELTDVDGGGLQDNTLPAVAGVVKGHCQAGICDSGG